MLWWYILCADIQKNKQGILSMNPNQPQNQWDPFGQKPADQPDDGQPPVSPEPQQPVPPVSPDTPQPQSQPEVPEQPTPTNPVAPAQNPVNPPAQPVPTAQPQPAAAGVVTPPPNGGGSKKKIILLASIIGGAVLLVGALLVAAYFMFFNITQADYQEAADTMQSIDDIALTSSLSNIDASDDDAFAAFEETYAEFKAENETLNSLKAFRGADAELAAKYQEYRTAYLAQNEFVDRALPFLKVFLSAQASASDAESVDGDVYREMATDLRDGASLVSDQEMKDILNEAAALFDRFAAEFDRIESADSSTLTSIMNNIEEISDEFSELQEKIEETFGDSEELSDTAESRFNELSELLETRLN
jgi:hypothetical protein